MKERAVFKFNGGLGALLCSNCRVIIKIGNDYTAEEHEAAIKGLYHPPQYCEECLKIKQKNAQ